MQLRIKCLDLYFCTLQDRAKLKMSFRMEIKFVKRTGIALNTILMIKITQILNSQQQHT